jgi:hypothetical protein
MLRTWSDTGSISIENGTIDACGNPNGPAPGGGGGAGGSIVLISRTITYSNSTLRANGAAASGGGGGAGKVVALSTYAVTNGSAVFQANAGPGAFNAGGAGGIGVAGGPGGPGGKGGGGGKGGKGGFGGWGGISFNYSTGGDPGDGGAFGAGGLGGMPGPCFWFPFYYWLICPSIYWHYWDFGTYPGYGWEQPWFDDSAWRIGLAPFGYGEGNEATTINSTNQYKTAYFRQPFVVTNSYDVTNLTLMLRRDDGVIVYLNGIEVLRNNMPTGLVTNSTPALSTAPDDGNHVFMVSLSPYLLHNGTNLLAAEVHQATATANDMTFDLALMANGETPHYTQVFLPGDTLFTPQLMPNGSNSVRIDQLIPNPPPMTTVFIQTATGVVAETFDDVDLVWYPGTTMLMSGYGARLHNPTSQPFTIEITGLPPYPPRTISPQPNVPMMVGRQEPGTATYQDILANVPLMNGTKVTRLQSGQMPVEYTYANNAWSPQEPVAELGEAVLVTRPCLYLNMPSNVVVEATSPQGAIVNYPVTAQSYCGGTVMVNCNPPSGSLLPIGTTIVTCLANNGSSQQTGMFAVSVFDTTAPTVAGASNRIVEATSPSGAIVNLNLAVSDLADPAPQMTLLPPSGSLFRIGTTPVHCVAWDRMGNTNDITFTVTVADTVAPQIFCPGNFTIVQTQPDGATLPFQVITLDQASTNLMVEYSMPPGATFPVGTTHVTCTATDASGNQNTCSFDVTVVRANPGVVTGFNATSQGVSMSFPSQAGVEYMIEYKDSINDPDWQPLTTAVGNGNQITINDPNPSETMRFYRVRSP